jgi:hypothetical protein
MDTYITIREKWEKALLAWKRKHENADDMESMTAVTGLFMAFTARNHIMGFEHATIHHQLHEEVTKPILFGDKK